MDGEYVSFIGDGLIAGNAVFKAAYDTIAGYCGELATALRAEPLHTTGLLPVSVLRDGGYLLLYGPYMRDGQHTAPSNAAFDASLRARNPDWGVRDIAAVSALAQDAALTLVNIVPMPSNNLMLAFERRPDRN